MGQKQRKVETIVPLDQRFEMERGIRGERFRSASGLWMATDRADGEPYLIRDTQYTYDLRNPALRDWWIKTCKAEVDNP